MVGRGCMIVLSQLFVAFVFLFAFLSLLMLLNPEQTDLTQEEKVGEGERDLDTDY